MVKWKVNKLKGISTYLERNSHSRSKSVEPGDLAQINLFDAQLKKDVLAEMKEELAVARNVIKKQMATLSAAGCPI